MEETSTATQAPPLPPKNLKNRSSPLQESPTTVLPKTVVAPSVTFVDLFHNSKSTAPTIKNHVVKILINPDNDTTTVVNSDSDLSDKNVNSDKGANINKSVTPVICDVSPCIRISLNPESDMIHKNNNSNTDKMGEMQGNYFYYSAYNYGIMSSGQVSPSDTLDSGTCSDLDGTPPPLSKKNNGVSVTLIGQHQRAHSSSSGAEVDSDDNDSSVSCDSLNSGKISPIISATAPSNKSSILPQMLLQDIRQRNSKLSVVPKIDEKPYDERKKESEEKKDVFIDPDSFYNFHINENSNESLVPLKTVVENDTFAGHKDILFSDGATTIRSAKGTVRGVKNRVRAGIATFLQINNTTKNYKEKEAGKVVVYTTTMGVLRDTYQACMKVKQILRTLLVKFEERDVFMSSEYQTEIQERMRCDQVLVPQVFVDGQHIGDAETIERLNESGELRRIMKPFKSMDVCTTCKVCGGFRLLPCQICKGSKKSVHRNHFTAEFVALKCMNCDEVGLVRCSSCS